MKCPRLALLLAAALLLGGADAYTVKPGDTLYSIARAHGTTVAEIMRLNKLGGTTIAVGQTLRLPDKPPAAAPSGPLPPGTAQVAGLTVTAPASLRMGDAFVLRLSGPRAAAATVSFPSEVGEDVRLPNERLTPIGAAGEYVVLGRVVLGKTTPVTYEVRVGEDLVRGSIPVTGRGQLVQHLNLPRSISSRLEDPGRKAEEATVEQAYARRTPQAWTRPFQPAVMVKAQSSAFGQARTYVAGGPVLYHYGTDYPAPVGTPVLAVNDGTVVVAGKYPVRGGLVVIDHGAGVTSLYFHQSRVTVKVGQKVTRGQKIGEVGSTGLSAGPHLHLEIRVRGEGTDPAGWMNRIWPKEGSAQDSA
ncbi:M23 family metallopeptidase [Deinococcus sp. YIM 77859]|uniref:LysM peptidoglycan-binding domain-containing M23 family metallopeptidase n=1 Tax=Deinococcus sp. YIM 77859 TaxID=1540221 RepID=UPI0005589F81|nr:M23 family metallopeptidase [Deinococcus sp. YIM 77859]